jgi:hypothetical protein
VVIRDSHQSLFHIFTYYHDLESQIYSREPSLITATNVYVVGQDPLRAEVLCEICSRDTWGVKTPIDSNAEHREVVRLLNSTAVGKSATPRSSAFLPRPRQFRNWTRIEVGRAVALATARGCPLEDVPEQLEDTLCHILVPPEPCNVTKERQASLFDDHVSGRCERVQVLVGDEMIAANS